MYRCNRCGYIGSKPLPVYEDESITYQVCGNCSSKETTPSEAECGICSKPLFRGDRAYEARDLLICRSCLTEIMI